MADPHPRLQQLQQVAAGLQHLLQTYRGNRSFYFTFPFEIAEIAILFAASAGAHTMRHTHREDVHRLCGQILLQSSIVYNK